MTRKVSLKDVQSFWDGHPLYAYESATVPGSKEFFDEHNQVRSDDVERFAMHLYEFSKHRDEQVLDIGCGIGWLCEHFAGGGARVVGLDLSSQAVRLTQKRLQLYNLDGLTIQGDAESLPFPDETFDFVSAAGTLHHTPETQRAVDEAFRVLRFEGRVMIALYYRNWLMSPLIWPLTRLVVRYFFGSLPGRNGFRCIETVDDFVRIYDGNENPLGKAYSRRTVLEMLEKFEVERSEVHYFPRRLLPFSGLIPRWLHRLLDRYCGTMLYVIAKRPSS